MPTTVIRGPILVTGATGAQGGGVVKALLRAGRPVRALVRDPGTEPAKALAAQGVDVTRGDFDDVASLDAALDGAGGVFSMQMPPTAEDPTREIRTGSALIDAAYRAGVGMFVHTSVARAGDQDSFVDWDKGRWWSLYWNSKSRVNEAVTARGFAGYVILKPAMMMDNLMPPKVRGMYPALEHDRLETALAPETRLDLIAADDVGAFAAAALDDTARFHGHSIDLAAEALTMEEVAAKLSAATGRSIKARSFSEEEMLTRGVSPGVVSSQVWQRLEGYQVDLAAARSWGVPLTSFEQWVADHRNALTG